MDILFALLSGTIISIMVSINGELSYCIGNYFSTVVIRVIGTIFALIFCFIMHEKIVINKKIVLWSLVGGIIGMLTTLFNNFSYAYISMTSIVALGLLGQTITSTVIDMFGLFGMNKHDIHKSTWVGLLISITGVAVMLDISVMNSFLAMMISVFAGSAVVFSRTVNANLACEAGTYLGTFYNHIMGVPFCILLWGMMSDFSITANLSFEPWMLLGGMLGVLSLWVFNTLVPRISSFRLTLLSFLGQLFTGFFIDIFTHQDISSSMFWGGIICASGFLLSFVYEYYEKKR